jgi:hypothetical protein
MAYLLTRLHENGDTQRLCHAGSEEFNHRLKAALRGIINQKSDPGGGSVMHFKHLHD